MPSVEAKTSPAAAQPHERVVVVYPHSNLFYWWVVWLYGYVCALLTYFQGVPFKFGDGRPWLVHPHTSVGMSYVAVLIFVTLFTTVKARSELLLAGFILGLVIFEGVRWLGVWGEIVQVVSLALVHMNMAFYVLTSTVFLFMWILIVFGVDRLGRWEFTPGNATEVQVFFFKRRRTVHGTHGIVVEAHVNDFVRHRILGLGLFGFGTGDLTVKTYGATEERFHLENVWQVDRSATEIQGLKH